MPPITEPGPGGPLMTGRLARRRHAGPHGAYRSGPVGAADAADFGGSAAGVAGGSFEDEPGGGFGGFEVQFEQDAVSMWPDAVPPTGREKANLRRGRGWI